MLTTDAPENPYSALKLVCCTLNSSMASGEGTIGRLRDAAVGLGVRDRSAIRQNVGGRPAAAVGNEIRAGAVSAALLVHLGDAGRQRSQLRSIAIDQRQVIDEPAIDDLARLRVLGLDGQCAVDTSTVCCGPPLSA